MRRLDFSVKIQTAILTESRQSRSGKTNGVIKNSNPQAAVHDPDHDGAELSMIAFAGLS
jgi:hypothetical protein